MTMKRIAVKKICLILLLVIGGCGNPVAHVPELQPDKLVAKPIHQPPIEQAYKIAPHDLITVRFSYHPEQDPKGPIAVRPDGHITLDGIGSVRAAGRTPEQLSQEIVAQSSKYLRDPEVVVSISEYAQRKVYVAGEVKQPGMVEFHGELTPLQAIFNRGGFTPEAQQDSVILVRDTGGPEPIIGRINLFQTLERAQPEKISLQTNDVLYVPMSGIGRAEQWVRQHLRAIIPTELFGLGAFGAVVGGS